MGIRELFSIRRQKERGDVIDTFQYDTLPDKFRVQIIHLIRDMMQMESVGSYQHNYNIRKAFDTIERELSREYGWHTLQRTNDDNVEKVANFILTHSDIERVLDAVELIWQHLEWMYSEVYRHEGVYDWNYFHVELNHRFSSNGIGYEYQDGQIIRVDSTFIHSEVSIPVLRLFNSEKRFKHAREEFLEAHAHYRYREYPETLIDANKSFESTLKVICASQGWSHKGDTASKLLAVCFNKGLIPSYLQTQFNSLRSLLESGVPTVRNKTAGHGQGVKPANVTENLASYTLHLTASNILFLINQEFSTVQSKRKRLKN